MPARAFGDLPLYLWLSPAFPVGAFAYSHGLEWAVEAGDLTGAASVEGWLADLIEAGGPRNDAILFADAYRAAQAQDWPRLAHTNSLVLALCPSFERRLETVSQGDAFVSAGSQAWACEPLEKLRGESSVAYPVAVAAACAGHALALDASLRAFALSLVANLVSASVRLSVIGQSEGQRILAALAAKILALAAFAATSSLDDLGSAALRSDIAAMKHETQYSRLFRS
jgi:urease accessory protein